MKIFLQKIKLRKFTDNKKSLGFVPTMGGIHQGHISLIKRSIKECNHTIVSIFINKQQFNNKRDFIKYPRILKKDIQKLAKLKINYLYLPKHEDIYPYGYNRKIKINKFKKKLCGKFRPNHFESIADVVDRFIKIINPNRIYFGEKDFQQLKIIEDFVRKNHPKCKIVSCKTIREKNGIPYSSRNILLSNNQKEIASNVFNTDAKESGDFGFLGGRIFDKVDLGFDLASGSRFALIFGAGLVVGSGSICEIFGSGPDISIGFLGETGNSSVCDRGACRSKGLTSLGSGTTGGGGGFDLLLTLTTSTKIGVSLINGSGSRYGNPRYATMQMNA